MATHRTVLNPLNNLTFVSGDTYNLIAPGGGHYNFTILNRSNADMAVSMANTVSLTDPASFIIPAGGGGATDLSWTILAWGTTGVWVAGNGAASIALAPKQG